MPFTFTMPKLSPTMEEGTITKWHKKEGDFVQSGELLLDVATDKATVEHNALDEGFLRKIIIAEGGSAIVNQAIAIFSEQKDENIENYKPEGVAPAVPTQETAVEVKSEAQPVELSKSQKGMIQQPQFVPEPPLENYSFFESLEDGKVKASPLAKRLAKEKNLDLTTLKGSGPRGRIVAKDLEKAQPSSTFVFGKHETPQTIPGSYEETVLSPMRKVIAKRLQESKSFIPHFYVKQVIDAEPMHLMREQLKNLEVKVSFNDMIVKACALALKQHPEINCGYNSASQSLISFKTIDISIAVSLPSGLITPIVRHADYKNLGELAAEIKYLAKKAREGKLEEHEYKGGSFSISNLGMYGIEDFNAVINPPQGAILAIGGIQETPVIKNQQVVPGKTLALTLSVDHRVIDGEPAAKFLKTVQMFLENPVSLIL